MTINYVPDNATSAPTRRQWEGETALTGGTVGPRDTRPESVAEETRSPLAAARGIVVACLVSPVLWAAIVGIVWAAIVILPLIDAGK